MGQAKSKCMNKKINKVQQKFESREEYFTKNGGILLEKQIALSQGQDIGAGQLRILREHEIKEATNDYDPDLVVGSSCDGIVYKGTFDDRIVAIKTAPKPVPNNELVDPDLVVGSSCDGIVYKGAFDDRIVAIKTAPELVPHNELVDLYLTDVSIGMVICHNSMAKIYGCCLETCVPMLMYEFYPNDLYRYLHGNMVMQKPLKWRSRLRAAADIAYALSYMHNALSKPVVHRDITSFGVLLDSSFYAKLASFGYAVAITPGKKDQIWPFHGIPGYIDPEYIETREVTEKCDVYSFGVLMLELITARDPVKMAKRGKDLVDDFASAIQRNGGKEMIDKIVLEEGDMDEIRLFEQLALTCVAKKGEERPNMISVVEELWRIQDHRNI
ncbi:hypothetical protein RND81_09G247200 [Saponaria officinalis]|uniref:Protein kinase domain-containing protein n=1 Tax=Saponaria officinalis TaxID=3572 RepID=A0AAW1IRA6_SAPOF